MSVYPTNRSSDQQQLEDAENHVRVGPKYRRKDVTLDGCNTIFLTCSAAVYILQL